MIQTKKLKRRRNLKIWKISQKKLILRPAPIQLLKIDLHKLNYLLNKNSNLLMREKKASN